MTMERFSKKAVAIGVGVVMGVSASILAMVPSSRSSEAAIAVFDEKNIEEAIKTANQTFKILTEEQMQYALMLLNMKKLDVSTLMQFLGTQDKNIADLNKQLESYRGVLDKSKTLEHVWKDTVGDYESVLNGDLTVYDMYKITKNRVKQAQDTVNDANIIVMNAQAKNKEVLEQSKKIMEQSNKAEGELQAQQSNTAAITNETNAFVQGNNLLTGVLSYQQMDRQDKEAGRAYNQAVVNIYEESGRNFFKSYDGSKNLYRE